MIHVLSRHAHKHYLSFGMCESAFLTSARLVGTVSCSLEVPAHVLISLLRKNPWFLDSRDFAEGRQIYAGVENVTNYRQVDPIIAGGGSLGQPLAADNPSFDASIVYAPIFGRNMYIGVRWALDR